MNRVLPSGASVCPGAARALERALACLDCGLLVSAWNWTEKARRELDTVTQGVGDGKDSESEDTGNGDRHAQAGPESPVSYDDRRGTLQGHRPGNRGDLATGRGQSQGDDH